MPKRKYYNLYNKTYAVENISTCKFNKNHFYVILLTMVRITRTCNSSSSRLRYFTMISLSENKTRTTSIAYKASVYDKLLTGTKKNENKQSFKITRISEQISGRKIDRRSHLKSFQFRLLVPNFRNKWTKITILL